MNVQNNPDEGVPEPFSPPFLGSQPVAELDFFNISKEQLGRMTATFVTKLGERCIRLDDEVNSYSVAPLYLVYFYLTGMTNEVFLSRRGLSENDEVIPLDDIEGPEDEAPSFELSDEQLPLLRWQNLDINDQVPEADARAIKYTELYKTMLGLYGEYHENNFIDPVTGLDTPSHINHTDSLKQKIALVLKADYKLLSDNPELAKLEIVTDKAQSGAAKELRGDTLSQALKADAGEDRKVLQGNINLDRWVSWLEGGIIKKLDQLDNMPKIGRKKAKAALRQRINELEASLKIIEDRIKDKDVIRSSFRQIIKGRHQDFKFTEDLVKAAGLQAPAFTAKELRLDIAPVTSILEARALEARLGNSIQETLELLGLKATKNDVIERQEPTADIVEEVPLREGNVSDERLMLQLQLLSDAAFWNSCNLRRMLAGR
jgi:hypothetical protein